MAKNNSYDVIIIGGSYAGLSAAMALGRALRTVLVLDSGMPCNRQTPHSHNFLTQDGEEPAAIRGKALAQVLQYSTVTVLNGVAVAGRSVEKGLAISTADGETFVARKIIIASGVKDLMPAIEGFSACWGISVLHCPYCHGYEVKGVKTGILANGDLSFHYVRLIRNWTKDLTVFTNGTSALTTAQMNAFTRHNIPVIEKEIAYLQHENGYVRQLLFKDHSAFELRAVYARPQFEQHSNIPAMLGCQFTEQGHISVDAFQKTTVNHVFACGDTTTPMRSVASAVATGNFAGVVANNEMTEEEF